MVRQGNEEGLTGIGGEDGRRGMGNGNQPARAAAGGGGMRRIIGWEKIAQDGNAGDRQV